MKVRSAALALVALALMACGTFPMGEAEASTATKKTSGWSWTTPTVKVPTHTYVNSSLPSEWPVSVAVSWVDGFTASKVVWGACVTGHPCITFRNAAISGTWTGWYETSGQRTTITIDVAKTKTSAYSGYFNYDTRLYVLEHELGHAYGIRTENSSCGSRMHPYLRCNGKIPARAFTQAEKDILAKR